MDINSLVRSHSKRQLHETVGINFQRRFHVTNQLISRLGLEAELEGHNGCVNCLEWNERGDLLASGSDDVQIILWDPFRHRKLSTIQTGHHGNIFSIKFLPKSNDSILVSGAADCKIRVYDLNLMETTQVCSCHGNRVKRIATAPNIPFLFWSAAEDGLIMQFDLRTPHTCPNTNNNVLINLTNHLGKNAEAKCLAINPLRPELLAVGANDPYVRLYDRRMITPSTIKYSDLGRIPWERPYTHRAESVDEDNLPPGCAQYFVAGHLPIKHKDYKKRYRTLASTYLTFSPDGGELLVNLGGEQIYLFDVNYPRRPKIFDIRSLIGVQLNGFGKDTICTRVSNAQSTSALNGVSAPNGVTNGTTRPLATASAATSVSSCPLLVREKNGKAPKPLSPKCELIKREANSVFEKQNYTLAISLYNEALNMCPDSVALYANRAAAYMKRAWDGDVYAALRDCYTALKLDHAHLKAHFRLTRCLFELQYTKESLECLQIFKHKFPEHATSHACESLDRDIKAANSLKIETDTEETNSESSSSRRNKKSTNSKQEELWRSLSYDYETRYCGHCNTTTDIKEANFFGCKGQYIVAGSDDGSFFIWDRKSTNIMRVLRGDDSIVNCLQPHPSYCLLATSGIDPVVRLWSPRPETGEKDDREIEDSEDAASANQRRMNADPLEVMLMNMGYRIRGVLDTDDEVEGRTETTEVQCRPS
uniref:WD and tetratricopeptide repeats protein 1 n=1 Tax=Strigamia maritima TaxID=126957 RepID=T1IVI1_STRMM